MQNLATLYVDIQEYERAVALCRRGPVSARVDSVAEQPANSDALNLRRAGERFSVLPTI